jgi:hypothetical protein
MGVTCHDHLAHTSPYERVDISTQQLEAFVSVLGGRTEPIYQVRSPNICVEIFLLLCESWGCFIFRCGQPPSIVLFTSTVVSQLHYFEVLVIVHRVLIDAAVT